MPSGLCHFALSVGVCSMAVNNNNNNSIFTDFLFDSLSERANVLIISYINNCVKNPAILRPLPALQSWMGKQCGIYKTEKIL